MTDTKLPPPPDGYATWLDYIHRSYTCCEQVGVPCVHDHARAELAALRAENERLRKALDDANAGEKS